MNFKTFILLITVLSAMIAGSLQAQELVMQPVTNLENERGVAVRIYQELEVIRALTKEGQQAQSNSSEPINIDFADVDHAVRMIQEHLVNAVKRKHGE